ncbi:GntR family transcriptional regulator [Micromonospora krabiensis]|uniref:GntR family transcriptional regulator n=1 Tax=Micromonospora krabiensis TaxID=307121 RepID=UPI000B8A3CE6|nr:GntR family transcriptional regulator [Micromonospora krabiensis]
MPTPHYGQPRYRAVADQLKAKIEAGTWLPGELLPPENALRHEYRVSRGTIRQAIALLRETGLLATAHGRGTYVAFPAPQRPGCKTASAPLNPRHVTADDDLAALFDIEIGSLLVESRSVLRANGHTESVIYTYSLPRQSVTGAEQKGTSRKIGDR